MRARTLGHISAGPLAVRKGSTSYILLWPTHLPSSLSPASVPSWESLRPNEKVRLELPRPPPASRPTPITPDAAELAGGPPSSPVSIPPSLDYWPAAGIYFKGTTHSTFGCCPPPLFLATLRRMTAPRGQRACASSPNRLGTGPRPPQHPSSILHFYFLQSPQINPFPFASYTRALHGPVWWRNSACCCKPLPHLGGEEGGAPRLLAPSPPEVSLPLLVRGLQAIPHPPTSPWSLSSQPSRSGAQLTQRRERQGGRGKEVVGGEQGWHRLWERRARVAMATADCTAARRGWGWQGGGVGMGPNWELHLGAAFSSPSPPPTWPRFLGKHPSSHMPLLITLVHCWPLPQAYPLGPGSSSLPAPQQTGVFRALTTRLSPGSLHTCISALPIISVLTSPFSTFQTLPGPPPVQRSGLPRPLYTPSLPLDPTLTHTDAD